MTAGLLGTDEGRAGAAKQVQVVLAVPGTEFNGSPSKSDGLFGEVIYSIILRVANCG